MSGGALVITQQPAQSLPATYVGAREQFRPWHDQVVPEPLMVPLPMVVRHKLVDHTPEALLPEQNQTIQALLANRPHEPLRVCICVWRLERRQDDPHSRGFHQASESLCRLEMSSADQRGVTRHRPSG